MSEVYSPRNGLNFKSISDITKRLISGPRKDDTTPWTGNGHNNTAWSGIYLEEIEKILRVSITTKSSPRYLHFTIKGAETNVFAAESLLTKLDQHAAVIAKDNNLASRKSIRTKDHELMQVHFRSLLTEAKDALTAQIQQQKEAKKPAQPIVAPVALAPEFSSSASSKTKEAAAKFGPSKAKVLLKTQFIPANIRQAIAYTAIAHDDIDVMFLGGAAGGGKTFVSIAAGLQSIAEGRCEAIEIYRPDQGAGNKQGAVPGDIQKKEDIFLNTVSASLFELTGKDLKEHLKLGTVKEAGTPFRKRGSTFLRTFVIIDEAQNLTSDQAKMLLTRIGEGAKVVITGDISSNQNDLKGRCPGLAYLIAAQGGKFNSSADNMAKRHMAFIEFHKQDSIARHRLLPTIHEGFEELPAELLKAMQDMDHVPAHIATATQMFMDAANTQLDQASKTTYNRFVAEAKRQFPEVFQGQDASNVVHFAPAAVMGRNP